LFSNWKEIAMQGRKTALIVRIDDDDREKLSSWLHATKTSQGRTRRALAILLLASGYSYAATARKVGLQERHVHKWARRFLRGGPAGQDDALCSGRPPVFSPSMAMHLVKLACEMPDRLGYSLSPWSYMELARKLVADGVVPSISPQTIGRTLHHHRLKPWRHHLWLSSDVPCDAAFVAAV